jgi:ADP-ribose pyrophosphatase
VEPNPAPDAPWDLLGRETVFDGRPWVRVDREAVRLPTGRIVPDFYRVVLPDFVMCVVRTADGRYPVVRGYKHGLGGVTLSPPAGQIDPGEEPLTAARRELLEETGYEADGWQMVGRYIVDGNRQCGTMHLFTAHTARPVVAPRIDELEQLEVACLTRSELVEAVLAGRFRTLPGVGGVAIALLLAEGS